MQPRSWWRDIVSTLSKAIAPIKDVLPEEAKDLKLNLGSVIERCSLDAADAVGAALAASIMARSTDLVEAFESVDALSDQDKTGARTAAALMAMNTTWYPFVELADDPELETMQAGLRMNAFTTHGGVSEAKFEMLCLSAAIIGQCHKCVSSHVAAMRNGGYTTEQIRDVGRIAATIAGVATVLDTMAVA